MPHKCHPDPLYQFQQQKHMKNQFQSLTQDSAFVGAIQGLQEFIIDSNADCDMAYDWVCDQAECHSFVADKDAWDMFYDTYEGVIEAHI